jgi:hypothetical protein
METFIGDRSGSSMFDYRLFFPNVTFEDSRPRRTITVDRAPRPRVVHVAPDRVARPKDRR